MKKSIMTKIPPTTKNAEWTKIDNAISYLRTLKKHTPNKEVRVLRNFGDGTVLVNIMDNEHWNPSHFVKYIPVNTQRVFYVGRIGTTFAPRLDQSPTDIDRAILTLQSKPSKEVDEIYSKLAARIIS